MPIADPIFKELMQCGTQAEADAWIEREVAHYLDHDPEKERRVRPLSPAEARYAIIAHIGFNAGYYGKATVDQVERYFGKEAFTMASFPQSGTRPKPPERTRTEKWIAKYKQARAWLIAKWRR